MKIKVSKLSGYILDWAVAKCEGVKVSDAVQAHGYFEYHFSDITRGGDIYSPSTDWAQGGPIIEREKIAINNPRGVGWIAEMWHEHTHPITGHNSFGSGNTPLEAAMRCYVASKLGNEVEIPKELS